MRACSRTALQYKTKSESLESKQLFSTRQQEQVQGKTAFNIRPDEVLQKLIVHKHLNACLSSFRCCFFVVVVVFWGNGGSSYL